MIVFKIYNIKISGDSVNQRKSVNFARKFEMIKVVIIAGLVYILYSMVFKRNQISGGKEDLKIKNQENNKNDNDEGEYVDYEEVD